MRMEKTIEEVAYNLYPVYMAIVNGRNIDTNEDRRRAFMRGAELGYKEAITQAREWLMNYFVFGNSLMSASGCDLFLRVFDNDMNKLWGEKEIETLRQRTCL